MDIDENAEKADKGETGYVRVQRNGDVFLWRDYNHGRSSCAGDFMHHYIYGHW